MKRLLLIALMAGGLAFIPAQRSDAQVSVGIGVGYPSYGYRYYILVWIRLLPVSDTTRASSVYTVITTGARTTTGDTATTATIGIIIATTDTKSM